MSKVILTYFSFVIACLAVIVAFITATNYLQLAVAILLYPLLAFFAYKVFPKNTNTKTAEKPQTEALPLVTATKEQTVDPTKKDTIGISDIDKRVFLKLIGSAGLFLFVFSLFNKKAEGLFFKNLPGPMAGKVALEDINGNKIDPAQSHPMDGYRITETDDNVISFHGFINKVGAWFIMRLDSESGSFRYAKGDADFPGNWSNRENLKYDYFNNIF